MSDFVEFEEMYFLRTFWNFVGPCVLQEGLISGSYQYCSDSGFATTYISQIPKGNYGSHEDITEKLIKGYARITTPMEKLLKKEAKFQWNEDCHKGLDTLKKKLVTIASILIFPYWNKEFHVHVDASSIALGAVLSQPGEGDIDHPIDFASRKLSIEV
jgi:hypothetical protein